MLTMRFAYVDLLTKEAMEKIISRSEEVLDGRHLLIKNGNDFEGRPAERKKRYQVKRAGNAPQNMKKDTGSRAVPVTENDQSTDRIALQATAATLEKTRRKVTKNEGPK
jgi:hypothetical protein